MVLYLNMENIKFSIVTYLTGEDYKIVRQIQKDVSEISGSKKCLVDWLPHITIGDGIIVSKDRLDEINDKFQDFSNSQKFIRAKISGFDGIDNWKGTVEGKVSPYVIWLEVEVSDELRALRNKLDSEIISKEETWLPRTVNYAPHITIAFSDLDKDGYDKGLNYLKNKEINIDFEINHVSLVECYGEGNMTSVEYRKFYFQ